MSFTLMRNICNSLLVCCQDSFLKLSQSSCPKLDKHICKSFSSKQTIAFYSRIVDQIDLIRRNFSPFKLPVECPCYKDLYRKSCLEIKGNLSSFFFFLSEKQKVNIMVEWKSKFHLKCLCVFLQAEVLRLHSLNSYN